jgi:hypothetical protein
LKLGLLKAKSAIGVAIVNIGQRVINSSIFTNLDMDSPPLGLISIYRR